MRLAGCVRLSVTGRDIARTPGVFIVATIDQISLEGQQANGTALGRGSI